MTINILRLETERWMQMERKDKEFWRKLVAEGSGSGNRQPRQWLASVIAKRMGLNLKRPEHQRIVRVVQQGLIRGG